MSASGVRDVGALILFSGAIEKTVAFYRAIGMPLEEEKHDEEGPLHYACELGSTHMAIHAAPGGREQLLRLRGGLSDGRRGSGPPHGRPRRAGARGIPLGAAGARGGPRRAHRRTI